MAEQQEASRKIQQAAAEEWDRYAEMWDAWTPQDDRNDAEQAADLLAEYAKGGTALELGVGTGRVAIPLAERGVQVGGIDASEGMLNRMATKPGGAEIEQFTGNFADVDVPGSYDLIFVALATLFVLPTQDEQVRCFQNVADKLAPGGRFVVHGLVVDLTAYSHGRYSDFDSTPPFRVTGRLAGNPKVTWFGVDHFDPATQTIDRSDVMITERGNKISATRMRYAYPAEQDLMGRLAGLELENRWGGWSRQKFDHDSRQYVSVYRKP